MVGFGSGTGSHGLREDFEVVRAGPVMLLLVLLVGVLFDKELTGLLQDSSALRDGTTNTRSTRSEQREIEEHGDGRTWR